MRREIATILVFGSALLMAPRADAGVRCEELTSLTIPNTAITAAVTVGPGPLTLAGGEVVVPISFCRVAATLRPSNDSDIKIEVWMPAAQWNRKLQSVGNGAFSGSINYNSMIAALARGYTTASTDTGHTGNTAHFGLGHPEKVIDFGWRAVHEMTVTAKIVIAAYYDAGPRYSYWNGCSAGGRQGTKEAQRFPDDYDGIIAGAPGLDWTGRAAQAMRIAKALETNEAARLTAPARELLHRAAVAACDTRDGLQDGLISAPDHCAFDPSELECKPGKERACLTCAQIATARLIYSGRINRKTGRKIAGLAPGSELGWTDAGWTASARATGLDQFRYLVVGDPAWTAQSFDFESDIVRADEADRGTLNALDTNLMPFFNRGGKLLQYHGWSDPQISPGNSVEYFASATQASGGAVKIQGSYRLFMAPGMAHCGGGEGPSTFDAVSALEQWVEHDRPPDPIDASLATNGIVDRSRPLCPYPALAVYKGTGNKDDAASYVCGPVVKSPQQWASPAATPRDRSVYTTVSRDRSILHTSILLGSVALPEEVACFDTSSADSCCCC
jgi:feruloyl esterase